MPEGKEPIERPWLVPLLYTVAIGGNLVLAYAWWAKTPAGQQFRAAAYQRLEPVITKIRECEGCAKRREILQRSLARMHGDAQRIVEGEEVATIPDPEVS
jgi:hypothetical protein